MTHGIGSRMTATWPGFDALLLRARLDARLTQEELAARAKVAARTISDLERGRAKFPHADTVLRLADALELNGPERALFEAAARGRAPAAAAVQDRQPTGPVPETIRFIYRLCEGLAAEGGRRIGIVTGELRRIRHVDIWINSENTDMKMSRIEDYTISAIIRYQGARRDAAGHVVEDTIANELARAASGICPVAAGTAIRTGSGQLATTHNVRAIIHVAAVHGEPGAGYRQIRYVGQCVTNALTEIDRMPGYDQDVTVLFPMLGTGQGGGDIAHTAAVLVGAAADYLAATPVTRVSTVWFLAHRYDELAALQEVLAGNPRFTAG
jgi:transcriptional regulator with XRE-family HTH domain